MRLNDLTGQKFGKLTVLSRAESRIDSSGKARTMWNCHCDCGNDKIVSADYLKQKKYPSCGCEARKNRIEKNRVNNIGQKFGRLTIVDILWDEKRTKAICKCDCGNEYVGRYTITMNGKEYDTVLVVNVSGIEDGVVTEEYLDLNGNSILFRRFDRGTLSRVQGEACFSEYLPNSERIFVNGDEFVLWIDTISEKVC